jgi:hypothetical protein
MTAADEEASSPGDGPGGASLAGFEMHDEPEDERSRKREG